MTQESISSVNQVSSSRVAEGQAIATIPQKTFLQSMVEFIKSLGEWRDRALVITGLFYATGYLIWSWNALKNNLGLLPAFQFQYIVAGIGPVVIGVLSGVGGFSLWRLLTNVWLKRVEEGATPFWATIHSIFLILGLLSFSLLIFLQSPGLVILLAALGSIGVIFQKLIPYEKLSGRQQKWRVFWFLLIFFGFLYGFLTHLKLIDQIVLNIFLKIPAAPEIIKWNNAIFIIAILFGPSTALIPKWLLTIYRVASFVIVVVGFALISLFFYFDRIYVQLPQEFGGVKPRCAYIDIKAENLSADTLTAILSPTENGTNDQVLRSDKLDVLFTGNNIVMVRPKQQSITPENTIYEIPRSNIQAITWCK